MPRIHEVFVAGGQPTITYAPREELGLEQQVRDYLDERYKILSLSGPTKCGKTVLLKSTINGDTSAIWTSGGRIHSVSDIWTAVVDEFELFEEEDASEGQTDLEEFAEETEMGARAVVVGAKERLEQRRSLGTEERWGKRRKRPLAKLASDALRAQKPILVIDDFHYIQREVQLEIVRAVKDLVFDGVPVIFASVPHRAFDAVRVEKEMTGRVAQVEIPLWKEEELARIPDLGFRALNVHPKDGLTSRLTREAFGSPHLMQAFCLNICKELDVRETLDEPITINFKNWKLFFSKHASETERSAFDRLARGPRQRSDRKPRPLKAGGTGDIYEVVLKAIAHTGPRTKLTYEEIRKALRAILTSEVPQSHEVTRVLEEMARIARNDIEGEPVVDWDSELRTVYISDPFFAFFLRWGSRDVD